jgi:hypothetical protein
MNSLRILGKVWAVRWAESGPIPHAHYGQVDYRAQEIVISQAQHPDQQLDTLLHEALHALDQTLRLELSEGQVHALAGGLVALLRDNPELAARLGGREVEDAD